MIHAAPNTPIRRILVFLLAATLIGLMAGGSLPAAAQQTQATRPFDVDLSVEVCEGGQFPRAGTTCEGEPMPGQSADVLLQVRLEEGAPLLTSGYLRSSGFRVTPSAQGPDKDKVGEGNVKIGVVGIGTVGLLACVINQNPPDEGDHATLVVVLNISSTVPCDPGPALAKVKLKIKSMGEDRYEYTLDLTGAAAAAGQGGQAIELTTPVDISIPFFGKSQPNEDVSPATPGGMAFLTFVDEPGTYEFFGHFEGPGGAVSEKTISYDIFNPNPPKQSTNVVPLVVVAAVIVVIAVVVYLAWSRRRRFAAQEDWEYYEEEVYYEEDEYV